MRAAIRRGDGVAIPAVRAIGPQWPGNGPFGAAHLLAVRASGKVLRSGKGDRGDAFAASDLFGEVIGKAARELEHGLGGNVRSRDEGRGAFPADLDTSEEIGLRTREAEQPSRLEARVFTKDVTIRDEGNGGAAPIGSRANALERGGGQPAREFLRVELLVPRHFDAREDRQRVDHRNANAVQAAGGGISLAGEFAARMQHGEDDFERGLTRILGMLVHGHAAAIVGDRDLARGACRAFLQRHFDAVGVPGDGLVHRVVKHLGGEVMQRALVDPADVHAGAAANGLKPFQHLDGAAVVAFVGAARGQLLKQVVGHGNGYRTRQNPGAMGGGCLSRIIPGIRA